MMMLGICAKSVIRHSRHSAVLRREIQRVRAMPTTSRSKQHTLPPANPITKTTKRKLKRKKPIPPPVSHSSTPHHTKPRNETKKKKPPSHPHSPPNHPNSHQPQPPPHPSVKHNIPNVCLGATTQTSLTHSSYTRPTPPSVSPPFRSVICHRMKRVTRPHTLENSKNHARACITSPVPPQCTRHQPHTTTHPPTHNSNSPHSSPNPPPSANFSMQSHLHHAPRPIGTNKPAFVHLQHVSLDHYSDMPRHQNQQSRQPVCFRVGTNHQQHRSRNQNRNHAGTSLRHGISAFERTHPDTWNRKKKVVGGTYGQVNHPHLPTSMHTSWGPNPHQTNPCIAQIYPIQGNQSLQGSFRVHGHQGENKTQSSCPQTSAYEQSNPYPLRNIAQHDAYRGSSRHTPSRNYCTLQQPSPFAIGNAMPKDRPVEQLSKTPNSTQNRPPNSNETSMHPQSRVQSGMTRSDRPDRRMAGSMNIRNGQSRGTDANSSSQPFAGQPISSAKASRMKLQKRTASPTGEYYGIRCGREGFSGVATCWKSCSVFVVGYRDAVYEVFDTWEKAERFSDRCGTGASLTHRSNFRHFFGGKRNGVMAKGSVTQLPWERENEPKVVSLVVGAASLRFGIGSGIGGYGVFLSLNNPYNCGGMMEGHVTELRLQLKGLLEALEIVHQHRLVKDGGTVELYTVSQEIKNGIDHWLGRWDRSGQWVRDGKSVGSQDLWKAILKIRKELLTKGTRIHTIWIRRPNKVPALQQAVSLARVGFSSVTIDEGKIK